MRIYFYLILIGVVLYSFSSCSKGEIVQEPRFGTVSVNNVTTESLYVVQDGQTATLAPGADFNFRLVSGQKRFRFYVGDTLQKDTMLTVEPFVSHAYVLFKPSAQFGLKILDTSLNGLDTTTLPDSGKVKLSFGNFSSSAPSKVDIYLTTKTYIANVQRDIQVGEFLEVKNAFSDFKTITLGTGSSSRPQTLYSVTVKDPIDHHIVATSTINFPNIQTTGALVHRVFLLYLDANNDVNILMSK
jgi:hypothetical protein